MSELKETAAQFVDRARVALEAIAPEGTIGDFHGTVAFDPNVVFLQFSNTDEAYRGWYWTAAMGRADEQSEPTVLETELLPGDDALLAPQWVSWAERFADYQVEHAHDTETADTDAADIDAADDDAADTDAADTDAADGADSAEHEDSAEHVDDTQAVSVESATADAVALDAVAIDAVALDAVAIDKVSADAASVGAASADA